MVPAYAICTVRIFLATNSWSIMIDSFAVIIFCFSRTQFLCATAAVGGTGISWLLKLLEVTYSPQVIKEKVSLILFLAPIKSGGTKLSWATSSIKEGEGRGKLGQITFIAVSCFCVWIIHKCFDENNYEIKQKYKAIVCYFESTFIKHP